MKKSKDGLVAEKKNTEISITLKKERKKWVLQIRYKDYKFMKLGKLQQPPRN